MWKGFVEESIKSCLWEGGLCRPWGLFGKSCAGRMRQNRQEAWGGLGSSVRWFMKQTKRTLLTLLDAWGPCAASSRRAACAVCFRLRSRSVEPPTQGSHGQCAAGHTLWFLLPIGHWLDLTKGRRDGNLHRASRKPQMCGQILLPSNLAGLWDYLLRFWYWRYFIFKEVKELEYLVKYPEF